MGASGDEEGSSMASSESEGSEERTELVLRAVSTGHSGSDGEGDDQEDSESGDQEEEEEDDMDAVEAEMDAAEEEVGGCMGWLVVPTCCVEGSARGSDCVGWLRGELLVVSRRMKHRSAAQPSSAPP